MVIKKNAQTSFRRAIANHGKKNKRTDLLPFKDEAWFKKDFKKFSISYQNDRGIDVVQVYIGTKQRSGKWEASSLKF
jgi:hypothetical protein